MRLIVVLAIADVLSAQQPKPRPHGAQLFEVQAEYQGMAMEPWRSEITLRDTTPLGKPLVVVHERVDHAGGQFDFVAMITPDGATTTRADWVNAGHEPGTCHLTMTAGAVEGTVSRGGLLRQDVAVKPVSFSGDIIPDFALASAISLRSLRDADTLRLTIVRCLPEWNAGAVQVIPVSVAIRSGSAPRAAGGPDEPVWIAEGSRQYAFAVVVAKSDGQVLSARTPQGSVGTQTLLYRGLRH